MSVYGLRGRNIFWGNIKRRKRITALPYSNYNEKENKDVYMVALRDAQGELIGYYEKHEYRNCEAAELYKFD